MNPIYSSYTRPVAIRASEGSMQPLRGPKPSLERETPVTVVVGSVNGAFKPTALMSQAIYRIAIELLCSPHTTKELIELNLNSLLEKCSKDLSLSQINTAFYLHVSLALKKGIPFSTIYTSFVTLYSNIDSSDPHDLLVQELNRSLSRNFSGEVALEFLNWNITHSSHEIDMSLLDIFSGIFASLPYSLSIQWFIESEKEDDKSEIEILQDLFHFFIDAQKLYIFTSLPSLYSLRTDIDQLIDNHPQASYFFGNWIQKAYLDTLKDDPNISMIKEITEQIKIVAESSDVENEMSIIASIIHDITNLDQPEKYYGALGVSEKGVLYLRKISQFTSLNYTTLLLDWGDLSHIDMILIIPTLIEDGFTPGNVLLEWIESKSQAETVCVVP